MKKEILISIITPVFNAEKYIQECAESVFAQSWENWEWIIVDNGCTDQSMDIIQGFSSSRINILKEPNKGVSRARNKALAKMNGEFFCFLDADDVLPKFSLESRAQVLADKPNVFFVDGVVISKDKNLEKEISTYRPNFQGPPLNELLQMSGSCFFGNTWMIRREKDVDYKFNPEMKHAEDLLFYISICNDKTYDSTNQEVLRCRRGHQSAMQDLRGIEKGYKDLALAIVKLDYVDELGLNTFRKKAKSIMLKTWLKSGKLANFCNLLFSGI